MRDLLLIPGWGFDERVWQPVVEHLASEFRIGFDVDAMPENAIVCGWSLGAMRALELAPRRPDAVSRLVLVGATPRFVQAAHWPEAQPPRLLEDFAAAVAADPLATLRRFAALMNQGDIHARKLTRRMNALFAERIPTAESLAAGLAALRDIDLHASVPAIRQPTLMVHGEHDPLMPLAAGRWLAEHLPNARIEVFEGAAHAPFLSQAERFVALLKRFAHE